MSRLVIPPDLGDSATYFVADPLRAPDLIASEWGERGCTLAPVNLDPASAALYALIAVCLFAAGWAISSPLSAAERGSILAAVAAILIGIGWRIRRRDA